MTRLGALLVLVVAGVRHSDEPPQQQPPETQWSEAVGGVRCRVRAPYSAARGDLVRTSVEIGVVRLQSLTKGGIEFEEDLRQRQASLELVGTDRETISVAPYDPYSGMPPFLDNLPRRLWNPETPATESIEFPLAMAWDLLQPGDYRCRVRLAYEPERAGYFKGTLLSPEFPLRIDPAPPREETFLLPKALRVVETTFTTRDDGVETTIPVRQVVYGKADAEEVRLSVRNGFFLGTNLLRDGEDYGTLGGKTIEPDGANPIDSSYGSGPDAQKLGTTYTIVIFETADAPEHMWHPGPGSGGYRELWRRTIEVTPAR